MVLTCSSFKPYYNWNTFNTKAVATTLTDNSIVLNLIITGIPSILLHIHSFFNYFFVLNLIITGIPSILIYDTFKNI